MKRKICLISLVFLTVAPLLFSSVSREEARNIAFAASGLIESEASFVRVRPERTDERSLWEVDFSGFGYKYDVALDQETGEVLSLKVETKRKVKPDKNAVPLDEKSLIEMMKEYIPELDKIDYKLKREIEDNIEIYEIKATVSTWKYEAKLEAASGTLISFEKKNMRFSKIFSF